MVSLRTSLAFSLALSSVFVHAQGGSSGVDQSVVDKIRDEGMNHSQLADTLSYLSDVIGPRLTASPSMMRANLWTRDRLASWGLSNAHIEAWGKFGRGWQLDHFEAEVLEPNEIALIAYPKAWSPSLKATTSEVVLVDATDMDGLMKWKGKLKGKIVLMGAGRAIPARFEPQGSRFTDAQLEEMANATMQGGGRPGGGGGGGARRRGGAAAGGAAAGGTAPAGGQAPAGTPPAGGPTPQQLAQFRSQAQMAGGRLKFFLDEGVACVIDQSRGDDGTIFVQQASVPAASLTPPTPPPAPGGAAGSGTASGAAQRAPLPRRVSAWDVDAPKNIPQVTVSAEQYNRMTRIIKAGLPLKMHLEIKARFFDKDLNGYNTVAELPGSDLKDQLVMVGGHMDSWHSGTGATDNGAGIATAMEAIRILKAIGVQPRRTIRVAGWSGEEEGLLGSRGYVAQHFGKYANDGGFFGGGGDRGAFQKGPEYDKISGYFNLDNGSGKIRGVYLQGNGAVKDLFASWLVPFADDGAKTITIRNTGGTDHQSFDGIGIPGFQFIQDTIEYDTRTHHSNQDVFDRIQVDDLKQAAVIMATFLYMTAMRDEPLPRKPMN
jgi:hypothetical protein